MSPRHARYLQLLAVPSYVNVQYDVATGGLMATHVLHNFDRTRGHYEKEVQQLLFDAGHEVILESEFPTPGQKKPDGKLNGLPFEIKSVESAGHNAIKRKLNESLSQGCRHVVLYYPNPLIYSRAEIEGGCARYLGIIQHDGKADILENIWMVVSSCVFEFV